MSKLFQRAIRIQVSEGVHYEPIMLLYRGRQEKVAEILKQWRVTRCWWSKGIQREYFQIRTEAGVAGELYRDLLTGTWYLQRVYD